MGSGYRIANVALVGLCCFQVAGVVNDISAHVLTAPRANARAKVAPTGFEQRGWNDREQILARNLFGAQLVAEDVFVAPAPEPEEDLVATRLPLTLLGTVRSKLPGQSSAAIAERGVPETLVVRVGDTLERHEAVSVVRIERGRVVLQNGLRREELLLSAEIGPPPPPERPEPARRFAAAPREERLSPERHSTRSEVDPLQTNRGPRARHNLFQQAKIMPKFDAGVMLGMELRDIEDGSLYDLMGLENGDVIQAFNGLKIDSAAAGAKVLTNFAQASHFDIELADGSSKQVTSEELESLVAEQ